MDRPSDHFPRREYARLDFYADPVARTSARVLWAARDASAAWARAADEQDWAAVSEDMFRLAVFGRAYELNQEQWPHRKRTPTAHEWQDASDTYIYTAYLLAGRQLRDAGHRDRIPECDPVLDFCRAAMDACYTPIVDAEPVDPVPLNDKLLGEYDPLVRHRARHDLPCESVAGTFGFDPDTGGWVLQDKEDEEGAGLLSATTPPPQ